MGCSNSKATKVAEPTKKPEERHQPESGDQIQQLESPAQSRKNSEVSFQKQNETPKSKMEDELEKLCQTVKDNKITVGYWGIKGRAYPIRLLLTYKNIEFEDRCYYKDTAPVWFGEDKPKIGKMAELNFPSIPFVVDKDNQDETGDDKPTIIFQSIAVQRYLGRKYNLCAQTDKECYLEDMFEGIFKDIGDAMQKAVFGTEEDMLKWSEAFDNVWGPIESHMASHKYIAGDNLVALDFVLFSHMEMVENYKPNCFDGYEQLKRFRACIMEDKNVCQYVESRKKQPFFPPK